MTNSTEKLICKHEHKHKAGTKIKLDGKYQLYMCKTCGKSISGELIEENKYKR